METECHFSSEREDATDLKCQITNPMRFPSLHAMLFETLRFGVSLDMLDNILLSWPSVAVIVKGDRGLPKIAL